ncbi:hypothetical protein B0H13DRAFT_2681662 [Mycena leptocephala]|nr:hypothetical protein B0H13DRAFT_2681662 [Mycena leptocephala]
MKRILAHLPHPNPQGGARSTTLLHGLGPENVKAPPHASRGGEREREQSGRAKTRTLGRVSASRAVASGQHLIGNAPAGIPPVAGTLRSAHRFSPACLIHTHTHTAHHLLAIHTAQPSSCPSAQSFTFTSTYRAPARDWRKRQSQQRGREQRGKIGASTRTSPLASPGTPYRTSAAAKRGEKHCSSPLKVSPRSALFTSSDLPGMLRRKATAVVLPSTGGGGEAGWHSSCRSSTACDYPTNQPLCTRGHALDTAPSPKAHAHGDSPPPTLSGSTRAWTRRSCSAPKHKDTDTKKKEGTAPSLRSVAPAPRRYRRAKEEENRLEEEQASGRGSKQQVIGGTECKQADGTAKPVSASYVVEAATLPHHSLQT